VKRVLADSKRPFQNTCGAKYAALRVGENLGWHGFPVIQPLEAAKGCGGEGKVGKVGLVAWEPGSSRGRGVTEATL